jgi:hypothetical protein
MSRFFALLVVVVATAVACVTSAGAAPIPGATHVTGTWPAPNYLFFGGLASLGCPFVLHDYGDNAIGTLTATYNGWMGPIDQDTFAQQVLLRTHVTGTVQDVAGNTYAVHGNFTDSTTHADAFSDLLFDGVGQVSLSGPTGHVVGRAELRLVTAPPSYEFTFSSIKSCTV